MPSGPILPRLPFAIAGALALIGGIWLSAPPELQGLSLRVPGNDGAVGPGAAAAPEFTYTLSQGDGAASALPGSWPGFRGPGRDGTSPVRVDPGLWPPEGPTKLWEIKVGDGYAAPAVADGRVYLLDYDAEKRADTLRCLSLDDGRAIWEFAYRSDVKRNHGMSRTVPAVADGYVVSLGPKCQVVCLDAVSGHLKWNVDLVSEFGAKVPPWYAGQCPLIDQGRVILAPAGASLLVALDPQTGKVAWKSPNPLGWKQTHVSVTPMMHGGRRTFIYAGDAGVAGIDADSGALLWSTDQWRVKIAAVPSPVVVDEERILLCGGYDAGAMMLGLDIAGGEVVAKPLWRTPASVFGAEQQTPLIFKNHVFGVIPGGELVCLDLTGKQQWSSGKDRFGIGPYMLAGDTLLLMNDKGVLTAIHADPRRYQPMGAWPIFERGHEAWGPMALVPGRLLVRDFTRLACLDVGGQ
jgi:outer membrane protein assembly factor BamB